MTMVTAKIYRGLECVRRFICFMESNLQIDLRRQALVTSLFYR